VRDAVAGGDLAELGGEGGRLGELDDGEDVVVQPGAPAGGECALDRVTPRLVRPVTISNLSQRRITITSNGGLLVYLGVYRG
jgi:hypothetical protein